MLKDCHTNLRRNPIILVHSLKSLMKHATSSVQYMKLGTLRSETIVNTKIELLKDDIHNHSYSKIVKTVSETNLPGAVDNAVLSLLQTKYPKNPAATIQKPLPIHSRALLSLSK